eukprot:gene18341-biopygen12288
MAYCTFCQINSQARLSNLKQHEETAKHVKATRSISSNRKIIPTQPKDSDVTKRMEIEFAVAVACHSAILSIDHLGEIIVRNGTGSKLEKMKLHRTNFKGRVLDSNGEQLQATRVDFGAKFEFEAKKLIDSSRGDNSMRAKVNQVKGRFHNMLLEATRQFAALITAGFEAVKALFQFTNADPKNLEKELQLHYKSLKKRVFNADRKKFVNWADESVLEEGIPEHTIVMEFCLMQPGASDAEFRKIFAKIAEAANVQHDEDLASLSAAVLRNRSWKHLVETVDSIQSTAEKNPD